MCSYLLFKFKMLKTYQTIQNVRRAASPKGLEILTAGTALNVKAAK